ncbi:MAG: transglycosylase SLT domain-containing protein [Polyangia bacterium]
MGPYFAGILEGEAAAALAEDRLEDAVEFFDEIGHRSYDPTLTPRALFLAAYLSQRLGNDERALSEIPELAERLPMVADTALETAALAALNLEKYDEAIRLAHSVSPGSLEAEAASIIAADALVALERWEEAAAAYREHLERWSDKKRNCEVISKLVSCETSLATAGEEVDARLARDALARIERLLAQHSSGRWARIAADCEKKLREALGEPSPENLRERPAAHRAYEEARDLMRRMRNEEAERAFNRVVRLARDGKSLECRARLDRARMIRRQRDHERAAESFAQTAELCEDPYVRVRALYNAGRSYASAERTTDAIVAFNAVERDYPDHSYADDARLRAARCHLEDGDREKFLDLLSTLPDDYPSGDMRAEALWIVAHDAIEREDLEAARKALFRYFEMFPVEDGWYSSGRSGYWLGRVEQLAGNTESAVERYEHVIATAPLTYYMVLAHARLRAIDPVRATALIARLAPPGGRLTTRFPKELLGRHRPLATGIELMRLGLTTRGKRELRRLVADPGSPADLHLVVAALFRRTGSFVEAREVASIGESDWRQRYPAGNALARWMLAYPLAYEEEVAAAAKESGVDESLIYAVMREESGFNGDIESWANAIGLMQLILPTARSMGRRLGIRVNRRTLRRPRVNLRLGAGYLAYLEEKFDGNPALMIAGYNAGEGAVDNWIAKRGGEPLDEFVEWIPYRQTRGYTKRVLATYAVYAFLYGEERPLLAPPLEIPSKS